MSARPDASGTPSLGSADVVLDETRMMFFWLGSTRGSQDLILGTSNSWQPHRSAIGCFLLKAEYNLAAKPRWPHDSQCSARS